MKRREVLGLGAALAAGSGLGLAMGYVIFSPARFEHGFAVSQWQQAIDWQRVAESAPSFVYVKATEGRDHRDRRYDANVAGARQTGLPFGAYHYFRADLDPALQARWFSDAMAGVGGSHPLRPCVDVEHSGPGQSDGDLNERLQAFLTTLAETGSAEPIVYTTTAFAARHRFDPAIAARDLWIGDYESILEPSVPAPWSDWTLWQYTETAQVEGVPVPCTRSVVSSGRLLRLAAEDDGWR
jgi:lysozyme